MSEYEYALQSRFQHEDGTYTDWRFDNPSVPLRRINRLLDDADRLNARDYSRMEWRVVRRPHVAWEPVTGGLTEEQQQARDAYMGGA